MVGVYLVLFECDWKWGLPIALIGAAWAVGVTFWLIPTFFPQTDGSGGYPQANAFCLPGDTPLEMLANLLRDPWPLFRQTFDRAGLAALWRVFFPLGLLLPFGAADWLMMVLPSLALMLMSCMPGLHQLQAWYTAAVLPGLFAAVAVSLTRLSAHWARWGAAGLVCTTLIGYICFSHAPLGGQYNPMLYQITDHHRLTAQMVRRVPADARLAAQDPFLPHLSHREYIYMFLLRQRGKPLPSFAVDRVVDGTMRLERVEIAVQDADGFFNPVDRLPIALQPEQIVRVSLYWEALDAPHAERTISVRLVDAAGLLVAQYDSMPGGGQRPTSWWQKGWQLRDVYYLTIPQTVSPGSGGLEMLVYDSFGGQIVPWEDGADRITLGEVQFAVLP